MTNKDHSVKILPYLGNVVDEFEKKSHKWKIQITFIISFVLLNDRDSKQCIREVTL